MSYRDPNSPLPAASWTALGLANGWQNYDSYHGVTAFGTARYCKIDDFVYVQGLVVYGTGTIATLPVGFRPNVRYIMSITTNPNVIGRVDVDTNGSIVPVSYDAGWVSVCLSFVSDQ